ncbi:MAG: DMT family transporter [Bacillota bacterium]
MKYKKSKGSCYLYLLLCILLWASIPVVTKNIQLELDNVQTLFYSTVLSFITLGVIFLSGSKHKELSKYSIKQYLQMFVMGMLGNFLYYILLYEALKRTSASEGFILAYTWPMLVLILSFFILKEKYSHKKLAGVLISFSGIIIITLKGNVTDIVLTSISGNVLALAGALVFALFSVLGKKYRFDNVISVFVYFASALACLIPTVLLFSRLSIPSIKTCIYIAFNGIFVNGVSYILV